MHTHTEHTDSSQQPRNSISAWLRVAQEVRVGGWSGLPARWSMAHDPTSAVTPYVGHERAEADVAAESEAVPVEAGTHLVLREGNLALGAGGGEAAEAAERQRVQGPDAVMCPLWQAKGARGAQVPETAGAEQGQGASGAASASANAGSGSASVDAAGAVKEEKAQREARATEAAEAKAKKGSWSAVSAADGDGGGSGGGGEGGDEKQSQPFITEAERRALPEFFDGSSASKTPEVYAHIRAYMLRAQAAMKEPSKPGNYLTLTACRRALGTCRWRLASTVSTRNRHFQASITPLYPSYPKFPQIADQYKERRA